MSAESESGGESRTVKARVSDPDLLRALERAESDESMAEVVRSSLRAELLDDDEGDESAEGGEVPRVARKALREMRRHAGSGSLLTVETAESVVANHCNIPSESVRRTIFQPLRRAGLIGVSPRVQASYIQLDPEGDR